MKRKPALDHAPALYYCFRHGDHEGPQCPRCPGGELAGADPLQPPALQWPIVDGLERARVESSNLVSTGYSAERQVMAFEFKSGVIIHYHGVPLHLWTLLEGAESKGSIYARHIRGKFRGEVMTGPCPDCGDKGPIGVPCADCGCNTYRREERREVPHDVE